MTDETVLVIGDLFFPVGAGRGITQTLTPLDNGRLRRTVNGQLIDTTRAANRKFSSSITCTDMDSPSLAGVWKGTEFTIECIAELNQLVSPAADTVTLIRNAVPASIFGITAGGDRIAPSSFDDETFEAVFAEDVIAVNFRPILDMRVTDFSIDEDEYGAETAWNLGLEEI